MRVCELSSSKVHRLHRSPHVACFCETSLPEQSTQMTYTSNLALSVFTCCILLLWNKRKNRSNMSPSSGTFCLFAETTNSLHDGDGSLQNSRTQNRISVQCLLRRMACRLKQPLLQSGVWESAKHSLFLQNLTPKILQWMLWRELELS